MPPPVQCSGLCDLDHSLEPEGLSELRVGVTHAAHGSTEGHPMPSGVRGTPTRHWGADDSPKQAAAKAYSPTQHRRLAYPAQCSEGRACDTHS